MTEYYTTFLRAARNFPEFASAVKDTMDTGLSLEEARAACKDFNDNRTQAQVDLGLKMEFEKE